MNQPPFFQDQQPTILVIGGGAAGFFGAIRLAELLPEARITILEAGKEVLGKVRISGGGRCNVTHACFDPRELVKNYPRGQKELRGPFHRFAPGDTMGWFEDRGVPLKIEEDNRIFPVSNQSESIVHCLQEQAKSKGIEVILRERMAQLYPPESPHQRWKILCQSGNAYYADRLLLATGSNRRVWDLIAHLGHSIVPPVPSLFTFNIKDERIQHLPGLSVPNGQIKILDTSFEANGPILITHWGLSGPTVLKLSAWAARELEGFDYNFLVRINWNAKLSLESVREQLKNLRTAQPKKLLRSQASFDLPNRLWQSLLLAASAPEQLRWAELSNKQLDSLAQQITQCTLPVNGKSTFKDEFVTAGGVDLKEINFKTYESRIHHGLYFAGEVLDIDAVTGGFNFQAAWTGGWIAAEAIAESF